MRVAAWAGLYACALLAACPGSGPGPDTPTPKPTSNTADPSPAGSCNHENIAEVYLAASQRVRQQVDDRRKVGVIPVKVTASGCDVSVEVLEDCNLTGFYSYRPKSGKESKTIRNKADLLAEVPLGADSLAHKLTGGQTLRVDQTLVGVFSATVAANQTFRKQDLTGDRCIEATHYISKIFVGGFAAAQGSASDLGKVSNLFGSDSRAIFTQEGEAAACASNPDSVRNYPHELCSVPIKIALSTFSKGGGDDKDKCGHDLCEAGDALDAKCSTCAEAVCDAASYCCKSHWDGGCIAKAKALCKSPCSGCAHDICEQGDKLDPTCDPCVQKVCAADSYCCDNKWDASCTQKVVSLCNKKCAGVTPTCSGGQTWNGSACVCPSGMTWNGSNCVNPASCNHDVCQTGGPLLSSCDSCTQKICQADSYCCNNTWDSTCTAKVKELCAPKKCPCDDYGTNGKCEGKILKYCVGGNLKVVDCSLNPVEKYCGKSPDGFASCRAATTPPPPPPPFKKPNGAACTSNSECQNNSCFGGKCQLP